MDLFSGFPCLFNIKNLEPLEIGKFWTPPVLTGAMQYLPSSSLNCLQDRPCFELVFGSKGFQVLLRNGIVKFGFLLTAHCGATAIQSRVCGIPHDHVSSASNSRTKCSISFQVRLCTSLAVLILLI